MSMPDLIPLEVLFGNPEKVSPQLSRDGGRMAFLAPVEGVLNVWVGAVGSDDARPVTDDDDRGIRAYTWAHDNEHLLYIQDVGGDENWHLYAVHLDSGEIRDLTPFDGVQARFVAGNKDLPDQILIGLNNRDPRAHDVYRLDLPTGELTLAAENPGDTADWIVDRQMQVRACVRAREDGGRNLLVRDAEGDEWRTLVAWSVDDGLAAGAVGFTKDGSALYVQDPREANACRVLRMEIATGECEVLGEDPIYDVTSLWTDPETYEPQAVVFQKERLTWLPLEKRFGEDLAAAQAAHHGDMSIVSRDNADRNWLLEFNSDDGPLSYYAFDRTSRQATFLFHSRPALARYTLARMEPISYRARDGLTIHGYLTRSPDAAAGPGPMVLHVHGGPWSRNAWGYDPSAQWLANRGYVVLQVNFRGSTGYGKAFLNAGDREWGAKMHDDLLDGVAWAVEQGYTDPTRVGIMGGSYGGYAALVGATFTPEVFACAVDMVGPSSIKTLLETIPPYWHQSIKHMFATRVGDPIADEEFLWSRSPLSKVDQIRIPVLIAQGANDPRVKRSESEQIVAAMEKKGIPHEYVVFDDEGHGFAKPQNRLKFTRIAESFLATHLGGRKEAGSG